MSQGSTHVWKIIKIRNRKISNVFKTSLIDIVGADGFWSSESGLFATEAGKVKKKKEVAKQCATENDQKSSFHCNRMQHDAINPVILLWLHHVSFDHNIWSFLIIFSHKLFCKSLSFLRLGTQAWYSIALASKQNRFVREKDRCALSISKNTDLFDTPASALLR